MALKSDSECIFQDINFRFIEFSSNDYNPTLEDVETQDLEFYLFQNINNKNN